MSKRRRERSGGWRRDAWKAKHLNKEIREEQAGVHRPLGVDAKSRLVEVRAFIVAWNRGNARGAKGRREMDA